MLHHYDVMLKPDPSRTVIRPFSPDYPDQFKVPGRTRLEIIVERVLGLSAEELTHEQQQVTLSLDERHRDVDALLLRRFDDVADQLLDPHAITSEQRRLIGAYLSQEYAFEAAALFNPSAVLHPDQSGAPEGGVRFVISLRGIGEGHVSSATFRSGSWTPGGALTVDPASPTAVAPIIDKDQGIGPVVRLQCGGSRELSETVLFPMLPSQRQGIEDVRLCRFVADDGQVTYYGTYTAFSGADARPEMLAGTDFKSFEMRLLSGDAAGAKGMALFPRLVDGRYMMLGRQDSESIWLHASDDLYTWNGGAKLVSPRYPWEFVQMGNCGSPIEIDEGWLVLTHGVGTVRTYCMGACLLDKYDPGKLLARTPKPMLEPSADQRDGYVPNVVYSCGALLHGRDLLIPFGVADDFTAFASASVDDLLAAME